MIEEQLQNAIQETIGNVIREAEQTAIARYGAYSSEYELAPPVVTSYMESWNRGVVSARGNGVLFQEYGTGVGAVHPDRDKYGFTPGSWSKTYGTGQFAEKGYWYYKGRQWVGVPPSMAMYEARKTIIRNFAKTFEEALKK